MANGFDEILISPSGLEQTLRHYYGLMTPDDELLDALIAEVAIEEEDLHYNPEQKRYVADVGAIVTLKDEYLLNALWVSERNCVAIKPDAPRMKRLPFRPPPLLCKSEGAPREDSLEEAILQFALPTGCFWGDENQWPLWLGCAEPPLLEMDRYAAWLAEQRGKIIDYEGIWYTPRWVKTETVVHWLRKGGITVYYQGAWYDSELLAALPEEGLPLVDNQFDSQE